ncbi:hypothetical protein IFM89_003040 [Coptis chinensis]|uniref:Cytochrome P450 n=1 Tax=Coptis chinensis TaxID=261450 RepID=A0A835MH18_9MAGN|nr:hypothetical protein IFM89_003040 [Coptis chinensis]
MTPESLSFFLPIPASLSYSCFLVLLAVFGFWLTPGGLAWAISKIQTSSSSSSSSTTMIPGPSGFPFLGLVLTFTGSKTHRVLAHLAKTFKALPLMAFSVGFTRFIISSSVETAKEILNSSAFADRPVKESAYELLFHRAMGFAPFGDYWRNLRRISATHLFCPKRIASFGSFRNKIGQKMIGDIKHIMSVNREVELKRILHFGSLNNVMMSVFGKTYDFNEGSGEAFMLEELVSEGYELLGIFNWSDHFPVLGWFDFQGVRKRCKKLVSKVNVFVGKVIEEHRMKRVNGKLSDESAGDFVDVLLDLEMENSLSDSDMIAVLWEMIFRGTDTVAILLEWILARMVLHPDIQSKAQSEIDSLVGNDRLVSDSDLPNLPYLLAIVKEPPPCTPSWPALVLGSTRHP